MEMLVVDVGMPAATVTVTDVLTALAETVGDAKATVMPAGRPVAPSDTAPAKLPPRVTVSPALPLPPGDTVTLDGVRFTVIVPVTTGGATAPFVLLLHPASASTASTARVGVRERPPCARSNFVIRIPESRVTHLRSGNCRTPHRAATRRDATRVAASPYDTST